MPWWATHEGQHCNDTLAFARVPTELTICGKACIRQIVDGRVIFPER